MIGECLSPWAALILLHRSAMGGKINDPQQDVVMPFKAKIKPTTAVVTGVGFFDTAHGQSGVAVNTGIEPHPVLKIEFP
jgi:hypothetical protein